MGSFFLFITVAEERLQQHSEVSNSVMADLLYTKQQLNRLIENHAEEVRTLRLCMGIQRSLFTHIRIDPTPRRCFPGPAGA